METEVTQADRDAAATYEEHWPPHMGGEVFRDGVADDHPLVQAFARHRRASQPPAAAGEGERTIEECAKVADRFADDDERVLGFAAILTLRSRKIADAIRSRKSAPSPFVDCAGEDGR